MKVTVRKKIPANVPTKERDVPTAAPVNSPIPIIHLIHVHTRWPLLSAHWQPVCIYPTEFICSECGNLWPDEKTNFCPHCGAKMK